MELFGIEIKRKGKEPEKSGKTFTPPTQPDGAVEIETTETGINFAQQSAYAFDLDAMPTDEFELLLTYRQLALQQEIDEAVQEIVNESIIMDDMKASVSIVLDDVELSENIKDSDLLHNVARKLTQEKKHPSSISGKIIAFEKPYKNRVCPLSDNPC